jgi:hypothetical protein
VRLRDSPVLCFSFSLSRTSIMMPERIVV